MNKVIKHKTNKQEEEEILIDTTTKQEGEWGRINGNLLPVAVIIVLESLLLTLIGLHAEMSNNKYTGSRKALNFFPRQKNTVVCLAKYNHLPKCFNII